MRSDVEGRFRRAAAAAHGKRKGYLGKALTEAMDRWAREKEAKDTVAQTLLMLDAGLDLRGLKYARRDELHER